MLTVFSCVDCLGIEESAIQCIHDSSHSVPKPQSGSIYCCLACMCKRACVRSCVKDHFLAL